MRKRKEILSSVIDSPQSKQIKEEMKNDKNLDSIKDRLKNEMVKTFDVDMNQAPVRNLNASPAVKRGLIS